MIGKVVEQQSVVGVKTEDLDLSAAPAVPRSVINGGFSIIFSKIIRFIVLLCFCDSLLKKIYTTIKKFRKCLTRG